MISPSRRRFLARAAALLAAPRAFAQDWRGGLFSYLRKEGRPRTQVLRAIIG